jgi:hypothetical protein
MSDCATENELPDLSDYITKSNIFYKGDSTKNIIIKYNFTPVNTYNHENNIYIGESNVNGSTFSERCNRT